MTINHPVKRDLFPPHPSNSYARMATPDELRAIDVASRALCLDVFWEYDQQYDHTWLRVRHQFLAQDSAEAGKFTMRDLHLLLIADGHVERRR